VSLGLLLLVIAAVLFGLAAIGIGGRINLVAAGLFCLSLAAMVGEVVLR